MNETFYNFLQVTHPRVTGFGQERARADKKKKYRAEMHFSNLCSLPQHRMFIQW